MSKLAVVRDRFLNPWDASNYYGVVKEGVDLILCGTRTEPDWDTIATVCPKATLMKYDNLWEVMDLDADVIDVPDPFYQFSGYFARRFERTVVVGWETLPGKAMVSAGAIECLNSAWRFAARSQLARAALQLDCADNRTVRVIHGAVNMELFYPGPPQDKREKAVLFIGRDAAEKGLADLICAMSGIEAELWVVGSDTNVWCQRLADQYGVDIRWFGRVPWICLPELYRKAMVFCLPSIPLVSYQDPYANWTEQFGQVLIEAMACATPIVATDCGAISEVLGDCGAVVPPRDWNALSDWLEVTLEDREVWKIESAAALDMAQRRYSQSVIGSKIVDWYMGA
jgi:glycosyltransferase involved in cell wall biosynthesis